MVDVVYDFLVEYTFPTMLSSLLDCMRDLGKRQDPPFSHGNYYFEILNECRARGFVMRFYNDSGLLDALFAHASRLDFFYSDPSFGCHSIVRIDDTYRNFSENLAAKWPGYMLQRSTSFIICETDKLVHLDDLLSLLRSKDIDRYHRQKELFFSDQARYTTGNSVEQMKVMYATYPRSGNSLMRKYFENVTGVATGSDQVLKHQANYALQFCGFKAEGIVDERCWINKTHFPYTLPFQSQMDADIAVVCTRFQLDADPSFFYLCSTMAHGAQYKQKLTQDSVYPLWSKFQRACTTGYKMWFDYWMKIAETTDKPVYWFRFEDILSQPEEELRNLFKFILGIEEIEGTVAEQRIQEVMKMGAKKNQTYKPRQGGVNRNLKNYREEQLEFTKSFNEEYFHIFGYVKDEERCPDNQTAFLDYEGKAKPENVEKINYFRKLNDQAMKKRMRLPHGQLATDRFQTGEDIEGRIKLVKHLDVAQLCIDSVSLFEFAH